MARTIAIIQARMGSIRLPGKVMADIAGHPMLWHVVTRVSKATTLDGLIVATSASPDNDPIAALCQVEGWDCFRGAEDDVLTRFYEAAKAAQADIVVRITADCPLHSGYEVDVVVRHRNAWDYSYVSNCHPSFLPDGLDCEVFTAGALQLAHNTARIPSDREHVTPWMRRNLPKCDWTSLPYFTDLSRYRLCVDTPADLVMIRQIMDSEGPDVRWQDAVEYLYQHPGLMPRGEDAERNAAYNQQLRKEQNVQA